MDTFYIEATKSSPEIQLDRDEQIFLFSGKSLPEDVGSFYEPVLEWFGDYVRNPLGVTALDIKLLYFNTASSKVLLDIFQMLEDMQSDDHKVLIRWHYPEYDEEMNDAGVEYSEMLDLEFEFIEYSD